VLARCAILNDMNTAFDIIVIILSATLFLFLVLAISVTVMVLKLVKTLRQIVARGEQLVDSAEAIGEALKRNAGAAGIVRTLLKFVSTINGRGKGE